MCPISPRSVVKRLLDADMRCRTMFATHYHKLVHDLRGCVSMGHMSCVLEERSTEDGEDDVPHVTFLYKLRKGACPKSHGLNVARLARLPRSVIIRAGQKSRELENVVGSATKVDAETMAMSVRKLVSAGDSSEDEAFRQLMRLWHEVKGRA